MSRRRRIADEVAQVVIENANVADVGDALTIDGAWQQTWRWIDT